MRRSACSDPCGEEIARGFAVRDFLASATDETLLDTRLRLVPDVRLEQEAEPSPEGWRTVASRLRLTRGLAYAGPTDPMRAALVGRCNGQRSLRELVAAVAASLETEFSSIAPACIEVVRRLIERGFLLPRDLEGDLASGADTVADSPSTRTAD